MTKLIFPDVIMTLLLVAEFILGIIESIYISKYVDLKGGCWHVWEWLLAACIFDICIPLFLQCRVVIHRDDDYYKQYYVRIGVFHNLLHIANLIISIWAAVVFFKAGDLCEAYWDNMAPELWNFVIVHFVMLWIFVAYILMYIVFQDRYMIKYGYTNI